MMDSEEVINVGQAAVSWQLYCSEHGIKPDGQMLSHKTFSETENKPHPILVDSVVDNEVCAVPTTHTTLELSDSAFLVDNVAVLSVDHKEFLTDSVPSPRIHFPLAACGPVMSGEKAYLEQLSIYKKVTNPRFDQSEGSEDGQAAVSWQLYCMEHGIEPNGQILSDAFFSDTGPRKPCSILVDSVLDDAYPRPIQPKQLYPGMKTIIKARGDWKRRQVLYFLVKDSLRELTSQCTQLLGFLFCHSFGGGISSYFTSVMMKMLLIDHQMKLKLKFALPPVPQNVSSPNGIPVRQRPCFLVYDGFQTNETLQHRQTNTHDRSNRKVSFSPFKEVVIVPRKIVKKKEKLKPLQRIRNGLRRAIRAIRNAFTCCKSPN